MMGNIKYKGPVLAAVGCVIIACSLGLCVSAAAAETASKGNLNASDGKVYIDSTDVSYLRGEVNLLQNELDDSVFGELPFGGTISASSDKLRNRLNSHGTINYDSDKVVVCAGDLLNLADSINGLGNNYATMIYRALGNIGTYYDLNGNVVHETQTAGNPSYLSCEQLAEGIMQSQSVGHLAVSPITSDNLTAGTAAWVNGQYVIGNGSDNEKSYQHGLEDGMAGEGEDVDIQYTCHEHVGNGESGWEDGHVFYQSNSPEGCFAAGGHTHDKTGVCSYTTKTSTCTWRASLPPGVLGQPVCGTHGNGIDYENWLKNYMWRNDDDPGGYAIFGCNGPVTTTTYTCDFPTNTWTISCGKKAGQIESATVVIHSD